MSPDVRRLFIALWPDQTVRDAFADLQKRLPPGIGRPVSIDNLHLTLVFLGSTAAERQHCIEQALQGIDSPSFSIQLDQLGYWRKPQVLWAGSTPASPPLLALVQALQAVCVRCGCEVDTRPYQTHLTLYRKVRKAPRDLPVMTPVIWPVNGFSLVESVTAATGAEYRVLRTWHLSGNGAASTSQ
jgi:2'-5' RNA ligase